MRQTLRHGFFFSRLSPRQLNFRLSRLRDIFTYPAKNATGDRAMNNPEKDEPVYWFVLLEKAVHHGDFVAAARAVRELKRLGISVKYRRATRERRREHAE